MQRRPTSSLTREHAPWDPDPYGGPSPRFTSTCPANSSHACMHVHSQKKSNPWQTPARVLEAALWLRKRIWTGFRDQAVLWVESQKQNVLVLLPRACLGTWLRGPRHCLPLMSSRRGAKISGGSRSGPEVREVSNRRQWARCHCTRTTQREMHQLVPLRNLKPGPCGQLARRGRATRDGPPALASSSPRAQEGV